MCAAGGEVGVTTTAATWDAMQALYNGASSVVNVDGTENTGNSGATNQASALAIFNNPQLNQWDSFGVEIGMWPAAFTGPQRTNLNANQQAFWITPSSGFLLNILCPKVSLNWD